MRINYLILALICFLTLPVFAQLTSPSAPPHQSYAEAYARRYLDSRDSNNNGLFESTESNALFNIYAHLDVNNDSALSYDELLNAEPAYLETGYDRYLDVHYKETTEESLYLDIYMPDRAVYTDNVPVVFYTHGGGWLAGDKHNATNFHYSAVFTDLIDAGYCVVAINYRLVNRAGRKTYVEDCVSDCQDAMRFIAKNEGFLKVDSNRFFTHGGSAGGHLSMMNLLAGSGQFSQEPSLEGIEYHTVAGIDWFGWADFLDTDLFIPIGRNNVVNQNLIIQPEDDTPEKELAAILEMSPSSYVRPHMPELLIQHGDMDYVVSVEHGKLMKNLADAAGGEITLQTYEFGNHNWGLKDGMTEETREQLFDDASAYLIARKNNMRIEVSSDTDTAFSLKSSNSTTGQYVIVSSPTQGNLSGAVPDLTYTPNPDFIGLDTFTYHYLDGGVASELITVKMVVEAKAGELLVSSVSDPTSGFSGVEAESESFRSNSVTKSYDADGDNAYGTDGYYFFGNGGAINNAFTADNIVQSIPSYISSVAPGEAAALLSSSSGWADYDNPTAGISATVTDWTRTAMAGGTTGATGTWQEILTITVNHITPKRFRLGVMTGNMLDVRRSPSGIRLSQLGSSVTPVAYTNLSDNLGMVFFDVSIPEGLVAGTTLSLQTERKNADFSLGYITGITFDSIQDASYMSWISESDASEFDRFADPDNDGVNNFLEYAFGGDPASPESGIALPEVSKDNGLSFNVRKDGKLIYELQTSLSLEDDWVTGYTLPQPQSTGDLDYDMITFNNLPNEPKLFMRLRITEVSE